MAMVYLAGKIGANDWRHSIFTNLRTYHSDKKDVFGYEISSFDYEKDMNVDGFLYRGPFFIGDDHRMMHGVNTHGRGVGLKASHTMLGIEPPTKNEVVRLCISGIDNSSHVFCWLEEETAYGTIAEIGYAVSKNKYTCIALSNLLPKEYIKKIKKILKSANRIIYSDSAIEAWNKFVKGDNNNSDRVLPSIMESKTEEIIVNKIEEYCEKVVKNVEKEEDTTLAINSLYRYGLTKDFLDKNSEFINQLLPYLETNERFSYIFSEYDDFTFISEVCRFIDICLVEKALKVIFKENRIEKTGLQYFYEHEEKENYYLFKESTQISDEQERILENLLNTKNFKFKTKYTQLNFTTEIYEELKKHLVEAKRGELESIGKFASLFEVGTKYSWN